jgi:hypothetical protein
MHPRLGDHPGLLRRRNHRGLVSISISALELAAHTNL